jgi:hypothetical protein
VFAPGAICALERGDGKLIWRRELHKYSGASVYLYERKLFAKTSNTFSLLTQTPEKPFGPSVPTVQMENQFIHPHRRNKIEFSLETEGVISTALISRAAKRFGDGVRIRHATMMSIPRQF